MDADWKSFLLWEHCVSVFLYLHNSISAFPARGYHSKTERWLMLMNYFIKFVYKHAVDGHVSISAMHPYIFRFSHR